MIHYPILFGFRDLIAGNDFVAGVAVNGRALLAGLPHQESASHRGWLGGQLNHSGCLTVESKWWLVL
jgi:hypothetical protein